MDVTLREVFMLGVQRHLMKYAMAPMRIPEGVLAQRLPVEGAGKLQFWVVDGRKIRDWLNIDFIGAGHDRRYSFVPDGQIWVEKSIKGAERPIFWIHELHERSLMMQGVLYNAAHEDANRVERMCRERPELIEETLQLELKQNNKRSGDEGGADFSEDK